MLDALQDREGAIASVLRFRRPDATVTDADRERFEQVADGDLFEMAEGLRNVAEEARRTAKPQASGAAEAAAERKARRRAAFARIDAVATRVERRMADDRRQATGDAVETANPIQAWEDFVSERGPSQEEPSLADSLTLRAELDHAAESWRRVTVDQLSKSFERRLQDLAAAHLTRGERVREQVLLKYLDLAVEKTSWDVVRLIEGVGSTAPRRSAFHVLWRTSVHSAVFQPSFMTDARPLLTGAATAEALAKMRLFGEAVGATRIVSTGAGGEMIGRFLAADMRLGPSASSHLDVRGRAAARHAALAEIRTDDRILIATDIATPRAIEGVRLALQNRASGDLVGTVALAGLAERYDELQSFSAIYLAHLTLHERVQMPWAVDGTYERTRVNHVFGYNSPSPFKIAREFMEGITAQLRARMSSPRARARPTRF